MLHDNSSNPTKEFYDRISTAYDLIADASEHTSRDQSQPSHDVRSRGRKNPVSHVGKVYNLLAQQIADRIYHSSGAIEEAYVWLCSRIGRPLDEPLSTSIQLALAGDAVLGDLHQQATDIVSEELAAIDAFTQRLTRGELSVC